MSEERRIFEYFIIAGLSDTPEELTPGAVECGFKNQPPQAPITDILVIFPSLGETVPEGFSCIEATPNGHPADLNHGSLRCPSCYLCYRRGYHKPPLVDIGVMYEGKEKVMKDSQILQTTPFGRPANVSNTSQGIYLTYRRAGENAPSSQLAVTDICVILENKGETAPHTFCKIPKNLNKGMIGSEVYICYKKSLATANCIAYKPAVLDRFPRENNSEYPFPQNVSMFCLPMGAMLECWPAKCQVPPKVFLTFVLTGERGSKYYGAAVSFWEPYDGDLTPEQMEKLGVNPESKSGSCSDNSSTNDPSEQKTFHVNKCICLLSRYPFFTAFKRYLLYLYRMSVTGKYPVPMERYISHLLYEVPFPSFRRPRILVQLGNETISFDNPEDSPLPISGASYIDFLKHLGPDHCMYILLLALTEQKLLLHSLRPAILTSVAEAVVSLLFPLHWQCPYIPQCPLDMAGVLHAPLPFIAGVDSRYFEMYDDPPKDVTCVDLDTNTISFSEVRKSLKLGLLPKRPARVLQKTLEILYRKAHQEDMNITIFRNTQEMMPLELDYKIVRRKRQLELEIQEAFLRFMAAILKGYSACLQPLKAAPGIRSTDTGMLFDMEKFQKSRDKSSHDFYKMLMGTQSFIRFIEERSLSSDHDAFLAVFDEVVEKVEPHSDKQEPKLLEFECSLTSDHTVFISPPEAPKIQSVATATNGDVTDGVQNDDNCQPEISGDMVVVVEPPVVKPTEYVYRGFPRVMETENFALEEIYKSLQEQANAELDERSMELKPQGRGSFRNFQNASLQINRLMTNNSLRGSVGSNIGVMGVNKDSPAVRRTKQEAKTALKLARQAAVNPLRWAKCLLSYAYSLWFIHLPSYLIAQPSKTRGLRLAWQILNRMQSARLEVTDEVCYRLLIQLCFQYGQPVTAVKVFLEMKGQGIQPNAITYGFYNKAVLEAEWPSVHAMNAQRVWGKVRNAVRAVSLFKRGLKERKRSRRTPSVYSATSMESDYVSQGSLNLQQNHNHLVTQLGDPTLLLRKQASSEKDAISVDAISNCSTVVSGEMHMGVVAKREVNGGPADQGYQSQNTEDSMLSLQDNGSVNSAVLTGSGKVNGATGVEEKVKFRTPVFTEAELELFDEFLNKRPPTGSSGLLFRSNSTVNRRSLPSHCGSVILDSSAGVLMTTEMNNDSVFGQSFHSVGGGGEPKRRLTVTGTTDVRPKSDNSYHRRNKTVPEEKLESFALPQVEKDECQREKNSPESPSRADGSNLNRIPEETVNMAESFEAEMAVCRSEMSCSTPTKVPRLPVTTFDPLGAVASPIHSAHPVAADDSKLRQNPFDMEESPVADLQSTPLLKKIPEDLDEHPQLFKGEHWQTEEVESSEVPKSSSFIRAVGASAISGSVRGFLNRFQSPVNSMIRSRTMDSPLANDRKQPSPVSVSPESPTLEQLGSRGSCDSNMSTPILADTSVVTDLTTLPATSPSLSNLAASLSNRVSSKLLRSKQAQDTYSRFKTRLSFAATELNRSVKGNLDQMSSPLKQSLNSLSSDFNASGSVSGMGGYMPPSLVGTGQYGSACDREETLSIRADESMSEGLWLKATEDMTDLPEDDPAFQLSSGETGSLVSFDFSSLSAQPVKADSLGSHMEIHSATTTAACVEGLEVIVSSCTRCPHCSFLLYDEEIMAGWNPDDSDLNTRCQFCHQKLVPSLTVCLSPFELNIIEQQQTQTKGIGGGRQKLLTSKRLSTSNYSVQSVPENLTGLRKLSASEKPKVDKKASISAENLSRGSDSSTPPASPPPPSNTSVNGHLEPKKLFDSPPKGHHSDATDSAFHDEQKPSHSDELWVSVPFLSPLVLRKELENVANQEGEDCLTRINFLHEHKILFWNILYLFERLSVPTHLKGWVKVAFAIGRMENEGRRPEIRDLRQNKLDGSVAAVLGRFGCYTVADNVVIRCVYDSVKLQTEERLMFVRTPPLYEVWLQRNEAKSVQLGVIKERSTPVGDLSMDSQSQSDSPRRVASAETSLVSALLIETRGIQTNVLVQMVDYLNSSNVLRPIHIMIKEYQKSTLISPLVTGDRRSTTLDSLSSPKSVSRQLLTPLKGVGGHTMPRHRSLYRELLFLAMSACGGEMVRDRFDAEFIKAFVKLPPTIPPRLQPNDRAPTTVVRACRKIFMPLDVC